MKDNALKYCTTIAFSAAMIAFALSGISRMRDAGDILAFCLMTTAALWLIVCFGGPFAAGFRRFMAGYLRKSDAMRVQDKGGSES